MNDQIGDLLNLVTGNSDNLMELLEIEDKDQLLKNFEGSFSFTDESCPAGESEDDLSSTDSQDGNFSIGNLPFYKFDVLKRNASENDTHFYDEEDIKEGIMMFRVKETRSLNSSFEKG